MGLTKYQWLESRSGAANRISWASGSKGKEVRADGKDSFLARGFWFKRPGYALGVVMVGPFKSKTAAMEALLRELGVEVDTH